MKFTLVFLTLFTTLLFAKEVTVSIVPQKYFVEKIAKGKVEVNVMVQPGFSPATYEPKTSQMKALSKSIAYFSIGVPFEKVWLEKFENTNKSMLIVDTSKGIKKLPILAHHHHDEDETIEKDHEKEEHHEHHEDEEHEGHMHTGLDPHIWLEPTLVKIQAKNIYEGLVKVDPKNRDFYKKNLDNFLVELNSLDKNLENILKKHENKAFMVFHPSWGYFSKRYHIKQIAIEIEGKEPKPAQLVKLIDEAKEYNIKIVFVAPQFPQKGAETISDSINANVVTIDPLAKDWDKNLIKVAKEIAKSYN